MVELKDQYVFGATAAATGLYALGSLAATRQFQDVWYADTARSAARDAAHRWHGHTLACLAGVNALAAKSNTLTAEGRKNLHRFNAISWATCAVHSGVNSQRGIQKSDAMNWGGVAALSALSALEAYKGFKKDGAKKSIAASSSGSATTTAKKATK